MQPYKELNAKHIDVECSRNSLNANESLMRGDERGIEEGWGRGKLSSAFIVESNVINIYIIIIAL